MTQNFTYHVGIGCASVGRVSAIDIGDTRFESRQQQILLYCIEKTKIINENVKKFG